MLNVASSDPDELCRRVYQYAAVGIVVLTPTSAILGANPAYCAMLGYAEAEILGRENLSFIHPEDRAFGATILDELVRGVRVSAVLELRVRCRDGTNVWVRWSVAAQTGASGELEGLIAVAEDISARKDAERSLLESDKRFRELCDGIPLIVWTAPANGTLDYANRAFSEYTGDTVDTPPDQVWLRAVHPEDSEQCLEAWRRAIRAGTPFVAEFRLFHKRTGRHRWHLGRASPLRDQSGGIAKWYGTCVEVHATKEAQEEASHLAEQLGATLESITDVFFSVDAELRLTYANAEAGRVLRLEGKHLLGRPLAESLSPGLDASLGEAVRRALPSQAPVEFEVAHDAMGAWFSGRAFPSRGGLAVYLRDVTEQREAREALRSSEERFRLLAQATNDAVWEWDLATDALQWSDGFERLFGFHASKSEPTFASWVRHLHPEDSARVLGSVFDALRSVDSVWSHEYRFRATDGTYAYVLDRGYIVRDAGGAARRMVGGMTDLTERNRVAERLADQAELIEKAQDAILVRDLQGRILYLNERAERLYGWKREEAIGKDARTLQGAADIAGFDAASEATLRAGEWRGELRQVAKDGHPVLVEGRWTLMRDARGAPRSFLVVNTDISERKQLEQQLLRTQRLESIGTLAGGIAHDLNNLLTPILFSIALLGVDEQDEDRREDLGVIEACAKRAAAMVGHLLAFARGVDGERATLYLGSVLAEVERVLRETLPKNIVFRVIDPAEAWAVSADRTQLNQVLINLCVNARDAMSAGGVLSVSVDNVVLDEVYAGMNPLAHAGSFVVLRVEDTGEGMSATVRDRIFEPFFTTKAVGKGTGLGLSTTHAIVKSHGGFINVYSEPGRGTTFKVYLPAVVNPDVAEQVAITQTGLPRGQGELVLVVDDEASIRTMVQRTLEKFGYRVIVAGNGAEAVALYALHRAEVAVVLTDMAMPVMDGPATIVALRSIDPSVRIIGSSGLDANGKVAQAVGAGVRHFVAKPYTAELMLTTLRTVLTSSD
ncbi:MAG: PAS domain S-box protein [Myxococcota bacterium]